MIEVMESIEHRHHDINHGGSHHGDGYDSHATTGNDSYYDNQSSDYELTTAECLTEVDSISVVAGPYLFPFILEYSLVAMSACTFMFSSINLRVSMEMYRAVLKALRKKQTGAGSSHSQDGGRSDHCSKAHTGLFLGILVLSGTVISMVLFFHFNTAGDHEAANLCYGISETVLLVLLLIGTILGMYRTKDFVVDLSQSNTFDHMLLLLSVSFYVILELFQLFSTANFFLTSAATVTAIVTLVVIILSIIQAVLQAIFILDGMQRVAVLGYHKTNKYGRGVITFLIVSNVAMWAFRSFQEKMTDSEVEYSYYGDVAWTIIRSVALPLILFFRFHSSICLAHMWYHCYQSEMDDIMQIQMLL